MPRLTDQRMAGRGDDHIGMGREGLADHLAIVRRAHHDRQIGQIGRQMLEQALAVVDGEIEHDAIVAADELDQQARKEIIAGADHRDIELAARDALELGHRGFGDLELANDRAADVEQLGAGLGQVDLLAELFEQGQAGMVLELAHLGRYRRLGQMQLLGGA